MTLHLVQIHAKPTELDELLDRPSKPTGEVHEQGCFVVTTHSPDANWQPVSGPVTCDYCLERLGVLG